VKGRKRHIVVDTLGLLLRCVVHPANVQDRDGAQLVLKELAERFPRLRKVWADGGYAGQLVEQAKDWGKWVLEIVRGQRVSRASKCSPIVGLLNGPLHGLGAFAD
jgi:putative transposase